MTQIFEDRGFRIHALTYAAVNILLLVINLATRFLIIYGFTGRSSAGASALPAMPMRSTGG